MRFRAILGNWMFLGIFTNFLARKLFNAIITIKHAFLMFKHLQGPLGEFQHLPRGLADVDAEITMFDPFMVKYQGYTFVK